MENNEHIEKEINVDDLKKKINLLEEQLQGIKEDSTALAKSPFLQSTILNLKIEWLLNREEISDKEFGKRINEKFGTMWDIKNQSFRYAQLLGIDSDSVRMVVAEALQNIIEHGSGKYVDIVLHINNDDPNPHLRCEFKHAMPLGKSYTMSDVNSNAEKGDFTSERFDFEDSRGRGEFMMKEIADERKIVNGIEIGPDGKKQHYFKRILIIYKDKEGPKNRVSFAELKREIDRLDYEDIVCSFHIDYKKNECHTLTIACHKNRIDKVKDKLEAEGFQAMEFESYYRTIFATFKSKKAVKTGELSSLLKDVRKLIYNES